jgi:hypothetical protein
MKKRRTRMSEKRRLRLPRPIVRQLLRSCQAKPRPKNQCQMKEDVVLVEFLEDEGFKGCEFGNAGFEQSFGYG